VGLIALLIQNAFNSFILCPFEPLLWVFSGQNPRGSTGQSTARPWRREWRRRGQETWSDLLDLTWVQGCPSSVRVWLARAPPVPGHPQVGARRQHGNFGASLGWSFVLLCFVLSPCCKGRFLFVPVPGEFVFWLIKERLWIS